MIGEKSDIESKDFDLHRCLNCGTVVDITGDAEADGD
jgi:hypothetical protein